MNEKISPNTIDNLQERALVRVIKDQLKKQKSQRLP